MTELIDKYGVIVEQAGYSRRNEYAPRTNLLYELIQYAEDNPRRNSCDQLMEWRVILLLGRIGTTSLWEWWTVQPRHSMQSYLIAPAKPASKTRFTAHTS